MRRVNLHTAESSLLRQFCRLCKFDRHLMNLAFCQSLAAQPRQIESAGSLRNAGRRIGKRSGVSKLEPELSVAFAATLRKFPELFQICVRLQDKISILKVLISIKHFLVEFNLITLVLKEPL